MLENFVHGERHIFLLEKVNPENGLDALSVPFECSKNIFWKDLSFVVDFLYKDHVRTAFGDRLSWSQFESNSSNNYTTINKELENA